MSAPAQAAIGAVSTPMPPSDLDLEPVAAADLEIVELPDLGHHVGYEALAAEAGVHRHHHDDVGDLEAPALPAPAAWRG